MFMMLPSDYGFWLMMFILGGGVFYSARDSMQWRWVMQQPLSIVSLVILFPFLLIGCVDSLHFRLASGEVISVLDYCLGFLRVHELSYSAPFAQHAWTAMDYGRDYRPHFTPLIHIAPLSFNAWLGLVVQWVFYVISGSVGLWLLAKRCPQKISKAFLSAGCLMWALICLCGLLSQHYHIFGTDKVGADILYMSLKSIRTALLVGGLTCVIVLPLAVGFGLSAGYFGGRLDHMIQSLYTLLTAVPGVLLISAMILSLNIWLDHHASAHALAYRSDYRLLALCIILGLTSWPALCRLLRGEALKLRTYAFVSAAELMGVGRIQVILRHLLPNVVPLILITLVLDFSGLVLAEAVLSYVGIGVDPNTFSWGNMINAARLELARTPVVWWPLASAFTLMSVFVLAINLFAEQLSKGWQIKE